MDFIVGLHKTSKDFDSIWAIVDRLIKIAHFISCRNICQVIFGSNSNAETLESDDIGRRSGEARCIMS